MQLRSIVLLCVLVGACGGTQGTTGAPPPPSIAISPGSVTLAPGATQQFTVTTANLGGAMTWTTAQLGASITQDGLYKAPSFATQDTVTVTSQLQPGVSASANVTIAVPTGPVKVVIDPATVSVAINGKKQLVAQVTGSDDTAVSWSVSAGTVSADGLFTAPGTPQEVVATATAAADPAVSAQLHISVVEPLSISGATWNGSLAPGTQVHFSGQRLDTVTSATVDQAPATFSVQSADALTLTIPAKFTHSEQAVVILTSPLSFAVQGLTDTEESVSISPGNPLLNVGDQVRFTATVTAFGTQAPENPSQAVTWTASSGTIDASGLYTATAPGTALITATTLDRLGIGTVNISISPPPIIDSISPAAARAGDTIRLHGQNLTGVFEVRFGGVGVFTLTRIDDANLDVVVPVDAPLSAALFAESSAGTGVGPIFTLLPSVSLDLVAQQEAHVGEKVFLFGKLRFLTGVTLSGIDAQFALVDSGQATFRVPFGAVDGTLTLHFDGGSFDWPIPFHVIPGPFVESFVPLSGAPGTSVLVNGGGFHDATSAGLGSGVFTVLSDTQISLVIGEFAATNDIVVQSPEGVGFSREQFTVVPPPPGVLSISPLAGRVGDVFTVFANHALWIRSVTIGGVAAPFTLDFTFQSVSVTVPPGAATGELRVASDAASESFTFTVLADQPVISDFQPAQQQAGFTVSVFGTEMDLTKQVSIGAVPASFVIDSPTQITVTVPAAAASGSSPVSLEIVAAGDSGSSHGPRPLVVFPPGPFITDLSSPAAGAGAQISVTVQEGQSVTQLLFGGVPARPAVLQFPIVLFSNTSSWIVPEGATDGPITAVANGFAPIASGPSFHLLPPIAVQPASALPGATVTLTAPGLGDAVVVRFGGLPAAFQKVGNDQLSAVVPPNAVSGRVFADASGERFASNLFVVPVAPARRILVVPLEVTSAVNACTTQDLAQHFFGAGPSVASFMAEASQGALQITGDVSQPVTSSCSASDVEGPNCRDFPLPPGVDPAAYDHIAFVAGVNATDGFLYAEAGFATNLNGTPNFLLVTRDCTADALSTTATALLGAFGEQPGQQGPTCDFSDTANGCNRAVSFGGAPVVLPDAPHRDQLGWLNAATVQEAATGNFALTPLGSGSGLQVLRLHGPWSSYYVSYRALTGTLGQQLPLAYQRQIQVSKVDNFPADPLLPARFSTIPVLSARLGAGESFSDPIAGLSVSVASVDAGGANVSVTLGPPGCVEHPASFTVADAAPVAPGGTAVFDVAITDNDVGACGPLQITLVDRNAPASITYDSQPVLSPGQTVHTTMRASTPHAIQPGDYPMILFLDEGPDSSDAPAHPLVRLFQPPLVHVR